MFKLREFANNSPVLFILSWTLLSFVFASIAVSIITGVPPFPF